MAGCLLALASTYGFTSSPGRTEVESFKGDRAWQTLLAQCAFGPRNPGSEAHVKCRDYLREELAKSCDNVRFQDFKHIWSISNQELTLSNILGEQNWKGATTKVVLLAHWDSRPTADFENAPQDRKRAILGANDGASGVSVLLELARVLKSHLPASVGVQYVLTDAEDLGPGLNEMFLGAQAYAADLKNHPIPTYGIVIDMVGTKNLSVAMEGNSIKYAKTLVYALCKHANQIGLGDVFPMEFGQEITDDHVPLNKAGLRTIDLIDFHYLEYWHTLHDIPENCSAESLGKVGKLLQTWIQKEPPFIYEG